MGYGIFYTMTPQGQHLQIEQEAQEARERDLQSRQEEIRAQKDSQEQAAQAQRDAEASAYNPEQLGGIGILSDGEPKDKVVVARDEKTVDQLVEAAAAKDSVGWTRILLSGRAFTVSYGTKAKHLSLGSGLTGFDKMHVRIMEGRHEGEDGWIPTEWLTKP